MYLLRSMRSIRLCLVEKRDGSDRLESTATNHDGSNTVSGRRGTTAPDRHTYSSLRCPATVRSRTTYPVRAQPRDRTRCATVVPGGSRESRTVHSPEGTALPIAAAVPTSWIRTFLSQTVLHGPFLTDRPSRIAPSRIIGRGHGPDATTPCRRTAHPCLDGSPTAVHWRSAASIGRIIDPLDGCLRTASGCTHTLPRVPVHPSSIYIVAVSK